LPGTRIGKGSIIGANSLVNKSVNSNEVWAGVPIKYICTVQQLLEKRIKENNSLTFNVEYIGEIEKQSINYINYKNEVIKKVKNHFYEKP
jgi:carbonic anhydrase/acetyltransferase-like protein (isoleucine patch superfamily)